MRYFAVREASHQVVVARWPSTSPDSAITNVSMRASWSRWPEPRRNPPRARRRAEAVRRAVRGPDVVSRPHCLDVKARDRKPRYLDPLVGRLKGVEDRGQPQIEKPVEDEDVDAYGNDDTQHNVLARRRTGSRGARIPVVGAGRGVRLREVGRCRRGGGPRCFPLRATVNGAPLSG